MYKKTNKTNRKKNNNFKMPQFIGGKIKGLGPLKGVEELLVA